MFLFPLILLESLVPLMFQSLDRPQLVTECLETGRCLARDADPETGPGHVEALDGARDAAGSVRGRLCGGGGAATEGSLRARWPEKKLGRHPHWSTTVQGLTLVRGPSGPRRSGRLRSGSAPADRLAVGLAAGSCLSVAKSNA
ncbi:hypothetical protein NDU88_007503 [Pleurodeles waltl]|uniref:Secreted protein n=1 Tax=Pleurodeles waltl TaxID=8319 RepID=A0AAV7PLI4_PLEWA|nr:hypothetical protein NDU88_007503 [Pleurodeles waltl]